MNNNLNADIQPGSPTQFNEGAPPYRTAAPGLNFDAHCAKCDKQVIVPVGFSEEEGFSLSSLLLCVVCPLCGERAAPAQVGCIWFSRCEFKMKVRPQDGPATKRAETVEELLDFPLVVDTKTAPASVIVKVCPIARRDAPPAETPAETPEKAARMPAPRG